MSAALLPVVGYESRYSVTDDGQVLSRHERLRAPRWMRPGLAGTGYFTVVLCHPQLPKRSWTVHQLVAMAFLGAPPCNGYWVNHKNGVKTDNRLENLEWCTPKENMAHAFATGLSKRKRSSAQLKALEYARSKIQGVSL